MLKYKSKQSGLSNAKVSMRGVDEMMLSEMISWWPFLSNPVDRSLSLLKSQYTSVGFAVIKQQSVMASRSWRPIFIKLFAFVLSLIKDEAFTKVKKNCGNWRYE